MPILSQLERILDTPLEYPVVYRFNGRIIRFNSNTGTYFWHDTRHSLSNNEIRYVETDRDVFPEADFISTTSSLEYHLNSIATDFLSSSTISSSPIPPPRFPIGSIVRFILPYEACKDFYVSKNITQERPLCRIVGYTERNESIRGLTWINHPCTDNSDYHLDYFIPATSEEIKYFEDQMALMNFCTEAPPIGTVVEYLDPHNLGIIKKRAVVVSHAAGNKILVNFLNKKHLDYNRDYLFNVFRIASNQNGFFVPNERELCKCLDCQSIRTIEYVFGIAQTNGQEAEIFCNGACARNYGYCNCAACGEWVHRENVQSVEITGGGHLCPTCATQYSPCNECSRFISNSDLLSGGVCRSCHSNHSLQIHDYSYKPMALFNKMAWENTRYLGIELEIEVQGSSDEKRMEVAQKIKAWLKSLPVIPEMRLPAVTVKQRSWDKLVYLKHDGSLHNGIEIVFHPITLSSFHKHFCAKDFLEFLKSNNCVISERCGMHVHVSKDKLSTPQLLKGKWLFYKCEQFIRKLSERSDFHYCQFEREPSKDPYNQEFGRRTALNVAGSTKTLEIRVFKSTLDYKKFLTNIQFADVFVDYIQYGAGSNFLKRSTPHQVWIDFVDYAKKQRRYQVMTNYILQNRIV